MGPPQAYFDGKPREDLEHLAATRRRDDIGKKAQIALDKLNAREGDNAADRRHKESIAVDRSARNIGWAAFGVAILALGVAVAALPQVQSLLTKSESPRQPTSSVVSPPVVLTHLSPASSPTVGSATSPIQTTQTKQPVIAPKSDGKPKAIPTSPQE